MSIKKKLHSSLERLFEAHNDQSGDYG